MLESVVFHLSPQEVVDVRIVNARVEVFRIVEVHDSGSALRSGNEEQIMKDALGISIVREKVAEEPEKSEDKESLSLRASRESVNLFRLQH
jgi:hypothetical protein